MEDKIWFTFKARIQAHNRLSQFDFHSQTLMVWYAILSACLAVVAIRYPQALGKDTDVISAVLSIALLGLSMAVANRDFRGRVIAMRQNYLDLQKLYEEIKGKGTSSVADLDRYNSLLCAVENHKEIDDKIFRVRYAHTLSSRKPTTAETIEAYATIGGRFVVTFALYATPLMIWWQM